MSSSSSPESSSDETPSLIDEKKNDEEVKLMTAEQSVEEEIPQDLLEIKEKEFYNPERKLTNTTDLKPLTALKHDYKA